MHKKMEMISKANKPEAKEKTSKMADKVEKVKSKVKGMKMMAKCK